MSRTRKPVRRRSWSWILILLLLVAGGVWIYSRHRPTWNRTLAALTGGGTPASVPATPKPPAPAHSAASLASPAVSCWSPPSLNGTALATARRAGFATVEQLLSRPSGAGRVYRVQARLLGYQREPDQAYLLILGSLVNPKHIIDARIPAGHCIANQEDAALFDELREDLDLHFGRATRRRSTLAQPVQVVVTGAAVNDEHGLALQPVLDFHVQ